MTTAQDESVRARPASRRRRRRWPWVVAGAVVLLLLLGWLALDALSAARTIRSEAQTAQDALGVARDALETGDYAAARTQADAAVDAVARADAAAGGVSLAVAGHLPYLSTAVDDVHALLDAAGGLAGAADRLVGVYGQATGKSGGTKLFAAGAVDLAQLAVFTREVQTVSADLDAARARLEQVRGTVVGTGMLAEARDEALAQLAPMSRQMADLTPVLKALPAALGSVAPKRYLVTILNPAELRPSGGAPLSVAVLEADSGRITVLVRGTTSRLLGAYPPLITWAHVAPPVLLPAGPNRFVNANISPDWPTAAQDLARAWAAYGLPDVDGVVSLDPAALAQVLKVTGPVVSYKYGEITSENLGQKLVVDAYSAFSRNQAQRQELNEQIVQAVVNRLTAGTDVVSLVRALGTVVPGRHVQAWVADRTLDEQVVQLGLSGRVAAPVGADRLAVYTSNINASKTDVFQQRALAQTVTLRADGGADVVRTLTIFNDTPGGKSADFKTAPRVGYTTRWLRASVLSYVPVGASRVAQSGDAAWALGTGTAYGDGHGGRFLLGTAIFSPGGRSTMTLRYSLPAGTFSQADGTLRYRLVAEQQPIYRTAKFSVKVVAPSGWTVAGASGMTASAAGATLSGALDHRYEATLALRR